MTAKIGTLRRRRNGRRRRALSGSVAMTAVASPVARPGAGGLDGERVLEVGLERARVGVAVLEVLVRHAVEDRREARGDVGAARLHVGEVLADVLHRHRDLVLAVEGDVAGEHLEQHDAEAVDVGLAVDVVAERLLGGDVVGGAEDAALGGQALLVERAGDAEVGDLGGALLVDQDVLGLDVAVDDVAGVGGAEGAGDLDRVGDRLVDGQAAHAADAVLQRLALDVLEDDVRPAVLLAGVDDADDVRVGELGDRARLAAEALELVRVRGDLAVHELDRDAALEDGVEGAIDRRHPAGPDLGVQPVPAVELHADESAHPCVEPIVDYGGASADADRSPRCGWVFHAGSAVFPSR